MLQHFFKRGPEPSLMLGKINAFHVGQTLMRTSEPNFVVMHGMQCTQVEHKGPTFSNARSPESCPLVGFVTGQFLLLPTVYKIGNVLLLVMAFC